jgi:transglutaminase-like putative cysteine protease
MYQDMGDIAAPARTPAPPARLLTIPNGRAGTLATLKTMRQLVRASLRAPAQAIRTKAHAIIRAAGVPPRSYYREADALQQWVRDRIHYVKDPVDLELVQAPERTLEIGMGDCDDKSTLLAALLCAVGHPCNFVAIGMKGGPLSHVLVETRIKNKWVPAETIIQRPFGWYPTGVTSRLVQKV